MDLIDYTIFILTMIMIITLMSMSKNMDDI